MVTTVTKIKQTKLIPKSNTGDFTKQNFERIHKNPKKGQFKHKKIRDSKELRRKSIYDSLNMSSSSSGMPDSRKFSEPYFASGSQEANAPKIMLNEELTRASLLVTLSSSPFGLNKSLKKPELFPEFVNSSSSLIENKSLRENSSKNFRENMIVRETRSIESVDGNDSKYFKKKLIRVTETSQETSTFFESGSSYSRLSTSTKFTRVSASDSYLSWEGARFYDENFQ